MEFDVPNLGGTSTLVFFRASRDSIAVSGDILSIGFRAVFPFEYVSLLMGEVNTGVQPEMNFSEELSAPPKSIQMTLVAGDRVRLEFSTVLSRVVPCCPPSSGTYSETYSIEAIAVPEPLSSLMLPSGIGFLAVLARRRGISLLH